MQPVSVETMPLTRRLSVGQGTNHITGDRAVVMTTVLGSCVACCLFDPHARIGGMNHFLLAEPIAGALRTAAEAERYGVFAMELLVNGMLKAGAVRGNLRAHLYGGSNMHAGMHAIGTANANFARDFLARDEIPLIHSDLGGTLARRVDFQAAMGRARCRLVNTEFPTEVRRPSKAPHLGEVELF